MVKYMIYLPIIKLLKIGGVFSMIAPLQSAPKTLFSIYLLWPRRELYTKY
jgi:hypothetical protein